MYKHVFGVWYEPGIQVGLDEKHDELSKVPKMREEARTDHSKHPCMAQTSHTWTKFVSSSLQEAKLDDRF